MISRLSVTWYQSLPPLMPVWSASLCRCAPWPSQDCTYTKQNLVNDLTDDKEKGLQGGAKEAGPELQGVAACRRMTAPLLGLNFTTHDQDEPESSHHVQDGVDDLIHDEGEELQDGAEDVVPRLEREAAFRQAAPKDDMTPEELEKFVKERYQDRAADLDVGRDAATSG